MGLLDLFDVSRWTDPRTSMTYASFFGAAGVALGAFGAHALKERLAVRGNDQKWATAVQYQMLHSIALLLVSVMLSLDNKLTPFSRKRLALSGNLFAGGTLLFSGSIYGLCLLSGSGSAMLKILGPTTPIGGLMMMGGWASLFTVASQW
eukprot:TRINITY_DN18758_c0_g1_i1.p1 TRINITY_DN18758_c0_g1~~TRINITY_DN18758_c0_g1_i1.p1  ORF type:complete len:149 (+),score=41.51 TRINITY_DN18758_c0_g1_i1:58-504(+)